MISMARNPLSRSLLVAGSAFGLLVGIACDGDEDPPGGNTSTSTSSGSGGATGGGGGVTGGSGGSSSGTGGQGGSSSSTTSTGTGGQGECDTCSEFLAECVANGCPAKNGLCASSTQVVGATLLPCLCGECYSDCEKSCTESGMDHGNCVSCLQTAVAGTCASAAATCNADN